MARYGGIFDADAHKERIKKLDEQMQAPDFWLDNKKAALVSQEASGLKEEKETWSSLKKQIDDLADLVRAGDESLEEEIQKEYDAVLSDFNKENFLRLFNGKYDKGSAILSIHSGTGGVDAQDFTEMLLRMYLRYAEIKGWKVEIIHETRGSEAGVKSTSFEVIGKNAYGLLKNEAGVHRLVRISPFDAEKMRHTSFALVEVLPDIPDVGEVELSPEDLKFEISTSQGAGGQSVNTTYSAVKVTHAPTGITVSCQNERSQTQNKEMALKILRARVFDLLEKQRQGIIKDIKGDYRKAQWGNQIRSYVLHPYQMVKDHRTELEEKDTEKFLNGEIDGYIMENIQRLNMKKAAHI